MVKVRGQTTLEIVERGIDAFRDLAIRNNELEEQVEDLKSRTVERKVRIPEVTKSRPHSGPKEPVKPEKGIVTGVKELEPGKFRVREDYIAEDGVRTSIIETVEGTLGRALVRHNEILACLFERGLVNEARLLRRKK